MEGLLREITERMHAKGGAPTWSETLQEWGIRFDAEALKIVLDEVCAEAGVQLMLHTQVCDVSLHEGAIGAVLIESRSGRQAVRGAVFVDGTGDADVAYRAGAPTTHGRPFDNRPESMGSFFHLAGYEPMSDERRKEITGQLRDEMGKGVLKFYNPGFLAWNSHHHDHTSANMSRFGGNSDDAADMTRGELSVRRDVWQLWEYVRKNVPEFRDCYVQQTSFQVGPRESRQIVGPYVLTGEDVRQAAKFGDAVARGSWWIDIHCPRGETYPVHLCMVECPKGADCPFWASEHTRMLSRSELNPPDGDWYEIPYRSLLSVGVSNLLSSGRCISATHEGMAGSRVMGTCIAIGQAAGTAAALALSTGVPLGQLDAQVVQEALRQDGQLI